MDGREVRRGGGGGAGGGGSMSPTQELRAPCLYVKCQTSKERDVRRRRPNLPFDSQVYVNENGSPNTSV